MKATPDDIARVSAALQDFVLSNEVISLATSAALEPYGSAEAVELAAVRKALGMAGSGGNPVAVIKALFDGLPARKRPTAHALRNSAASEAKTGSRRLPTTSYSDQVLLQRHRKATDMESVQFKNMAAQGDVLFLRVKSLPKQAASARKGAIVLAHSETGHHHVVESPCAEFFTVPNDPFTAYLRLAGEESADITHLRPFDTHQALRPQGGGIFLVRRQREYTPESWRMVVD